jgi:hypothetical protein
MPSAAGSGPYRQTDRRFSDNGGSKAKQADLDLTDQPGAALACALQADFRAAAPANHLCANLWITVENFLRVSCDE